MSKLTDDHKRVLLALDERTKPDGEACINFDTLSALTSFDRQKVRRISRYLARKGLAEYHFALWTEDKEPAGAGYCISQPGRALAKDFQP